MSAKQSFDKIWETIYKNGHENRYPWDSVVSFIYNYRPVNKNHADIRILEVGCGTGANLWFAAREGFSVAGLDGSNTAIAKAKNRFIAEGLDADLRVGDYTCLPFESNSFDLVIDRAALTCCGKTAFEEAIGEIFRVLKSTGRLFFNPYADAHISYNASVAGADDVRVDVYKGTLQNVGKIRFYARNDLEHIFAQNWNILSANRVEILETAGPNAGELHAEWRVVVEKNKVQ